MDLCGSAFLSAIALLSIALVFALKKESFNECVEEIKATGSPTADAVVFVLAVSISSFKTI